ncbi:MAG: replication factor C large subunit [Candidatus Aenigmarchaeota archaeon]|nr:replication factor C large subunit [Candidatus Aenigmarchaeota archaeon]
MALPYAQKYAPSDCSHIPQKAVAKLKEYVVNYKKQKKKAVLVYGPSGGCKTSGVHALAKELNLELVEVNASDCRNSAALEQKVGMAVCQASLFGMKKLILVDEIDGISGTEDRGGVPSLLSIIAKSVYPVVLTANDPWDHKFSKLLSKCLLVEFPQLPHADIVPVLKQVCLIENITHTDDNLNVLARRSGGDLRGALNDLQTIAIFLNSSELPELSVREKSESMARTLLKIFKTTDSSVSRDALSVMAEDHDELFLWLDENLPKEYQKPYDLARAYDVLGRADVFRGRIRRRQYWRFLAHISELLSAGISHSKQQRYVELVEYTRPMRLLRTWQLNQKSVLRKSIAAKLAELTHCSLRKTQQCTFPLIIAAAKSNKEFAEYLSSELELDEDEMEYLSR